MENTMTISTKQNPFLLFMENNINLMISYNFGWRNIIFTAHCFVMMMKDKRSYRKIFDMTNRTFITKFQNKFGFKKMSFVSLILNMFLRLYRATLFAITINTKSISVVFRKLSSGLLVLQLAHHL